MKQRIILVFLAMVMIASVSFAQLQRSDNSVSSENSASFGDSVSFERSNGEHTAKSGERTMYKIYPNGTMLNNMEMIGFYDQEGCNPGEAVQAVNPDGSYDCTSITEAGGKNSSSDEYVDIKGDTLQGAIDMGGFSLEGLPEPDSPFDAATKRYVDNKLSEIYIEAGSRNRSTPLSGGNEVNGFVEFPGGIMLGSEYTSANENSIAVGRGARALANNSIALGQNSKVEENSTARIGSQSNGIDLSVTGSTVISGNLTVKGDTEIIGDEKVINRTKVVNRTEVSTAGSNSILSGTIDIDDNRSRLTFDKELDDYTVVATASGTMAKVGVFNQTEGGFTVKSSRPTEANYIVRPER